MIAEVSPGLVLILGALVVPVLRGHLRSVWMLALPAVAFLMVASLSDGAFGRIELMRMTFVTLKVDPLSRIFGYVFTLAAFVGMLYALHVKDTVQHVAALIYAGAALAAVFAGDLVTLFVFWELTALSSVFLVWARRDEAAIRAGLRYLVFQIGSGVFLIAGTALIYRQTGSIDFGPIGLGSLAGVLIFLAFGIKCAFPLLHAWLQESYPAATPTGMVFLSAFTTKMAVYALIRGYAGTEILVPIGIIMVLFPLAYAAVENDIRAVLVRVLNSQLGFMVIGIGIGSDLAIAGVAAHAAGHVAYNTLLVMVAGAVLTMTGTARLTDLGGLARTMPQTAIYAVIGALAIATPLFCGFTMKSLIISSAEYGGYGFTWVVLIIGSVGAFLLAGLRAQGMAFFRAAPTGAASAAAGEPPANMRLAMGLVVVACAGLGLVPSAVYELLPGAPVYEVYTLDHVLTQLQLLGFTALGFVVLLYYGFYPAARRTIALDVDAIYRIALPRLVHAVWAVARAGRTAALEAGLRRLGAVVDGIYRHYGPEGVFARAWPTGAMALWATLLLAAWLLVYYL